MTTLKSERCDWCNALAARHRALREPLEQLHAETWRSNSPTWRRLHALTIRALTVLNGRRPNPNRPDGRPEGDPHG